MSKMRIILIVTIVAGVTCSTAYSQQARTPKDRKAVTVEPYDGPPLFLPRVEDPVPATQVDERTITTWYDEETKEQAKIERRVARFSDGSMVNSGPYREFYEDGQVFVEGAYSDGDETGEWTYYHPNGQIAKKVTFANGQPDGKIEINRADGTTKAIREFREGKRHGKWKVFDDAGEQVLIEQNYADGKADGVWLTYYANGQQRQQIAFKNGERDGVSIEWNEDGSERAQVEFKDGEREGVSRITTSDGRVIEQVFEEGELVSTKRE